MGPSLFYFAFYVIYILDISNKRNRVILFCVSFISLGIVGSRPTHLMMLILAQYLLHRAHHNLATFGICRNHLSTVLRGHLSEGVASKTHRNAENVAWKRPQEGHLFTVCSEHWNQKAAHHHLAWPQLEMCSLGCSNFWLFCACPHLTENAATVDIWNHK